MECVFGLLVLSTTDKLGIGPLFLVERCPLLGGCHCIITVSSRGPDPVLSQTRDTVPGFFLGGGGGGGGHPPPLGDPTKKLF